MATSLTLFTISSPLVNRAGLESLIANVSNSTGLGPSAPKTQREAVARALGETVHYSAFFGNFGPQLPDKLLSSRKNQSPHCGNLDFISGLPRHDLLAMLF